MTDETRLIATYHITADAADIAARAQALAIEQSVEMPLEPIEDRTVLDEIVAQVRSITPLDAPNRFAVELGIAQETTGFEPGQLINMLFGNSSIHSDLALVDVRFPDGFAEHFCVPRHGLEGLRQRLRAGRRPLTCTALKPQGLSPKDLALLAGRLALGGIDFIKDDHGLADQRYSRFAERVPVIADSVARAAAKTGVPTRYLPSLSGDLDALRAQIKIVRAAGLDTVLIVPMIVGLPSFHKLVREAPDIAFMAHPGLAGSGGLAPPMLLGALFRLLGADATIFPNYGGRFGYSPATCRALADAALRPWNDIKASVPVPAGGMTPARVPEMLDFYGADVMLLIGGALLSAGAALTEETARFVRATQDYRFGAAV